MKLSINRIALMVIASVSFQQTAYAQNQAVQIDPATSETTVNRPDLGAVATTPQDDAKISSTLKTLISKSSTLSKLDVNAQTNQGVVTLSGNVDSDSQASSLIELAQSIVGVKDVDAANLKVKDSQQPFTDMMITAKIKGLFIREKVFGGQDIAALNIGVETNNGVVYLTGTIDNQEQLKNAINIIQGVQGVKKVEYLVNKVTPNATSSATKPSVNGVTIDGATTSNGNTSTNNTTTNNNTNNNTTY